MKHRIIGWLGTGCLVFALFFGTITVLQAPGCATTSPELKQAAYEEAVLLINAASEEATRLAAKPNKTPEEAAMLAQAQATIERLQSALTAAADAEGQFDETMGLRVVTDFIPPPWNVPASLIFGSLGTWMKGRKTRETFKKLVNAINTTKATDPNFAEALNTSGPAMKAAMGPKAVAVIDLARKEGKFPVV